MQALGVFHEKHFGVNDIKSGNLVVQVAEDGSFVDCTMLDFGGCAVWRGEAPHSFNQ